MTSNEKSWPSRRDTLIGGLASGAFAIAGPAFGQAAKGLTTGNIDLPAPPHDDTVQTLHGVSIPDPYRPLEDPTRADVKAWIEAQDARTRTFIDALPIRKQLHDFANAAFDYPRTSIPGQYGRRYFTFFSDGLVDQRSVGVQDYLAGPRRTLIAAGTLS